MRRIAAVTAAVLVLLAGGWWLLGRDRADEATPGSTAETLAARARVRGRPSMGGEAGADAAVAAPRPDLPRLACDRPAGDAVRVGTGAITAVELCRELLVVAGAPAEPPSEAWRAQVAGVRDRLVDARLVQAALAAAGDEVPERDVDLALAGLAPAATSAPATEDGKAVLRRQVRARLELARLLGRTPVPEPDEGTLRAAYDRDPAAFGTPGEASVSAFARRLPRGAPDDEVAAAQQQVEEFLAAVAAGAAPAEAAAGAGLTVMAPFVLADEGPDPELRAAAFSLRPGNWSAPIRTSIGWVALRVEDTRAPRVWPFEHVRDRVRARVMAMNAALREQQLLRDLRAGIEVTDLVSW